MPIQVCSGALLACSCGAAPSPLTVLPQNRLLTGRVPAASIMDHVPVLNIAPFGTCCSPANPAFVAATAAAAGVPTPVPCIPVTPMPWTPGAATVLLSQFPTLDNTSVIPCMLGGVIAVQVPGQFTHLVP